MPGVEAGDHQYLAELTVEHVLQTGYNYADQFDFGLSLVLDALASAAST